MTTVYFFMFYLMTLSVAGVVGSEYVCVCVCVCVCIYIYRERERERESERESVCVKESSANLRHNPVIHLERLK